MRDKLTEVIRELRRCAKQNEGDANAPGGYGSTDSAEARAVAAEQRRMVRILSRLRGSE